MGVLVAPASGSDTIKKLSENAKNKYNRLKGSAENAVDNLESKGKNMLDKGSDLAKNYMKDGEQKIDGIKSQIDNTHL